MKKIEKILAFGLMAGIAVGGAFAAKKPKTIKIGSYRRFSKSR